ncbi:MAG: Cell division protein FtsK [Labilithrix sp.]|nr:Cell division protein FtsK [Labilithrix sp.]
MEPAALSNPNANTRSEPVFAPRRTLGSSGVLGAPAPVNTRLPSVLGAQPHTFARGREVAALLLWTFAVFLALALASYAGDPAGTLTPDGVLVVNGDNWVGPVGASVARSFVLLVGIAAWVVPLEALLLGIPYVRGRKTNATPARLAGDILMVVIAAALLQVGGPGKLAFGHHPAGGMIGELFGELARSLFSTIGSFLVGFALLGLILIGRATFSFIALLRWIARFGTTAAQSTAGAGRSVAGAWAKARELERENEAQRRREAEPHITAAPSGDATILVPDLDPEDEEPIRDSEPPVAFPAAEASHGSAPRVRIVTEPFPEESPLVVVEPPGTSKARRRKPDEEAIARAEAPRAEAKTGFASAAKANAKAKARAEADAKAAKAALAAAKVAALTKAKSDAELEAESVAKAVAGEEPEDDEERDLPEGAAEEPEDEAEAEHDEEEEDDASPPPAPVAKLATRKPGVAGITIVDTSAALEKDEPTNADLKEIKKQVAVAARKGPSFTLPSLEMLTPGKVEVGPLFDEEKLRKNAELLVKTLADYKITCKVEEILPGPVVTTYEVSPVAGTKVSKVAALADDLALALAKKVRIVAPIPGKNRIGFELPNEKRLPVIFRDLVEDRRFQTLDVPLPVVLGRDIVGNPVYADLASMPHAIVAGATGAGKSVGLNVMLTSLLYRRTPDELRMLMIDPKVVELAPFDRIPHMLLPVVTDMKQAATALKWAVDEMERRYQLFADAGTKNIGTYNAWVKRVIAGEVKNPLGKAIVGRDHNNLQEVLSVRFDDPEGVQQMPERMPMIVIVVDEFADLMMQQGKEVEVCVARLAQKARAAGMHVILATQRPSVDVITGMIKANFPTRIAYRVAQKVDSRTILDEQGAEHLLGKGDMLIKLNGTNETRRVQCPWISEEEVQAVTDYLRTQGEPVYDENILKPRDDDAPADEDDAETDAMYDDAVRIVAETRRCSTSWLQRKLGLGYNRAARIVETMERRGLVGPANGAKDREVLIDAM